ERCGTVPDVGRRLAADEVAVARGLLGERRRRATSGATGAAPAVASLRTRGTAGVLGAGGFPGSGPTDIARGDGRRRLDAQLVDDMAQFGTAVQSRVGERGLDLAAHSRADEG